MKLEKYLQTDLDHDLLLPYDQDIGLVSGMYIASDPYINLYMYLLLDIDIDFELHLNLSLLLCLQMCLELHLDLVFDIDPDPDVNFEFDYDMDLDFYNCLDLDCSFDLNNKFNL